MTLRKYSTSSKQRCCNQQNTVLQNPLCGSLTVGGYNTTHEGCGCLEYVIVQSGRYVLPWRRRQQDAPKRPYIWVHAADPRRRLRHKNLKCNGCVLRSNCKSYVKRQWYVFWNIFLVCTESVSYFGVGHSLVLVRKEPNSSDVLPYSARGVPRAGFLCVFVCVCVCVFVCFFHQSAIDSRAL